MNFVDLSDVLPRVQRIIDFCKTEGVIVVGINEIALEWVAGSEDKIISATLDMQWVEKQEED